MGKWLQYGVISTAIEMSSRSDGGTKELVSGFSSLGVLQETAFNHPLRMNRNLNRPAEKDFSGMETFIKAQVKNRSICLCLSVFVLERESK